MSSTEPTTPPGLDGWVVGVMGGPDPRHELAQTGLTATYADRWIALSGPVATVGDHAVAGRVVLDGLDPGTDPRAALAATWQRGGPGALMVPQGMFGAVIHDGATGRAMLTRDPLGERTMYYTRPDDKGRVWFSDRLTELRRVGAVGRELSLASLRDYLVFGFVPGTNTMYADAFEVPPGSTVDLVSAKVSTWWQPEEQLDNDRSVADNASLLRSVLIDAIASRRPQGPVGVQLTAGLDASAVTALLCHADPSTVHTFAVHFGTGGPDDLPFVDRVVDAASPAFHHVIELTPAELAATLPAAMAVLDDPIGDAVTVPRLALGRRAAQLVPVLFSGDGAGPLFGGVNDQPMLLAAVYGASVAKGELDDVYLRSQQRFHPDLDLLLRPEVAAELEGAPPPTAAVAPYLSSGTMSLFVNRLFEADLHLEGTDHILTRTANLAAATGILGRTPLLDRRIVEAAFSMPPTHKVAGPNGRGALARALDDLLPATVLDRPQATGRSPIDTWFTGALRDEATRRLLSSSARIARYLDLSIVRHWALDGHRGHDRNGDKLWQLLSLEEWLEANDAG
ncbi:MAG: asparagine synthetase B family protein [Acidimicrobiales bacterium]